MIATGNARRHTLTTVQLAIVGLILVAIGGCQRYAGSPPPAAASGSDTPVVISGGSIHFRATKKNNWTPCDGSKPKPTTTCYEAPFPNKADLVNYQFVNEDFVENAVPVTSSPKVTNGWEIDVVDTNPDNQHMVLVCAEIKSDYTACDPGPIHSNFVYVIVKGTGAGFDPPKGPAKFQDRLEYHDGDHQYDYVNSIQLNASNGAGGQQTTCTGNACDLFLSK